MWGDWSLDAALMAKVFVTLLVITDPVGNVPVFLTLTRDLAPAQRRRAAFQATGVAAVVIVSFALFGEATLRLLGISIESLQVAGGLLLVLVALELLRPSERSQPGRTAPNVALVPLGTPLLAGPGAIAATMVYARQSDNAGEALSVTLGLLGVVVVVIHLALRFAEALVRLLRDNGIELLSRVVGLLLAAIAVQLVASGVESWVEHGVT